MSGVSLDLNKGDKVVLRGEQKVSDMLIGLGWDPRVSPGEDFDLDAVLIGRDASGSTKSEWVCFFNSLDIGWAQHSGDSLTGVGEMDTTGDDERITVHLGQVPADVNHIDVLVIIYKAKDRKQTFGDLTKAHIRYADAATMDEKAKYNLTSDDMFACEGMLFGQIVRKGPTWSFNAVGATKPEYGSIQTAAAAVSLPA